MEDDVFVERNENEEAIPLEKNNPPYLDKKDTEKDILIKSQEGERECPLSHISHMSLLSPEKGTGGTQGIKGTGDMGIRGAGEMDIRDMVAYFLTQETEVQIAGVLLDQDRNYKEIEEKTSLKYDTIKKFIQRHKDSLLFEKIKGKLHLTEFGRTTLNKIYKEHLERQKSVDREEPTERNLAIFTQFFSQPNIMDGILGAIQKGNKYYTIDVSKDLLPFNPRITNELLENPEEIVKTGEMALESCDLATKPPKFKILLCNVPKSIEYNITKLRASDIDRLRVIVAEIRSRAPSAILITSIRYECPNCGQIITVLQTEDVIKEPTRCGCGRKGKFHILSKEKTDSMKLTVIDLYENLFMGDVPEEINVWLEEDNFDFSRLSEGERVRIIGILKSKAISLKSGGKSRIEGKEFVCVGLEKLSDDYAKIFITAEDEKMFEPIKQDPLTWHRKLLFSDLNDVELGCDMSIISLYGDISLGNFGDCGLGKTEIIKRITYVALRGAFVDCTNAKPTGLIGAVTQNPFTKKYSIDGGVFRSMHPHGRVCLDEIQRDPENYIQNTLLGILANKKLNVHKANVNMDVPCNVNISATANPSYDFYDHGYPEYKNFGINRALWDRIEWKVYFNNKLNIDDVELIKRLMQDNKSEFKLPKADMNLIKKHQIKAWLIKVEFSDEDYKKLAVLLKEFYQKIENVSYRRIATMKTLLESICRMHHRERPIKSDFQLMTDLIMRVVQARIIYLSGDSPKKVEEKVEDSTEDKIKQIINELENKVGKSIPIGDIVVAAKEEGIESDKVDEAIEKLKRVGDIMEAKLGFIQKI